MQRHHLAFLALAVTLLYGAGFALFDQAPRGYAAVGGVVVALAWVAVGVFSRDGRARDRT